MTTKLSFPRFLLSALIVTGLAGASIQAQGGTQKVWVMTYTGGGGKDAAKIVQKVENVLEQVKGISSKTVDCTSRVVFTMEEGKKADEAAINEQLAKLGPGIKVETLTEVTRDAIVETYTLKVKGYEDGESAKKVRDIFEKIENVLAAYPRPNGTVIVIAKKKGALDESTARASLSGSAFKLESFKTN